MHECTTRHECQHWRQGKTCGNKSRNIKYEKCKRTERVEDVPRGGGTLGQIAGNVDGNSMLAGREPADFALDGGGGGGGGLGQAEDSGYSGFAGDLASCRGGHGVVDVVVGEEGGWYDLTDRGRYEIRTGMVTGDSKTKQIKFCTSYRNEACLLKLDS